MNCNGIVRGKVCLGQILKMTFACKHTVVQYTKEYRPFFVCVVVLPNAYISASKTTTGM